jgi:hypothetical protein
LAVFEALIAFFGYSEDRLEKGYKSVAAATIFKNEMTSSSNGVGRNAKGRFCAAFTFSTVNKTILAKRTG